MEKRWFLLFATWCVALTASLGSLFFSEIMQLPPCVLCWYQRIAMYPLVLVLARGLFPLDLAVIRFTWPLALAGWLVASYHNLLYYGFLPESVAPCTQGISCTSVQFVWLGFVTIPLLSLTAFSLILGLSFMLGREKHE